MRLPTQTEIKNLYDQLQIQPEKIDELQLSQAIIWSRLDARLAEILVVFFERQFSKVNPLRLRDYLADHSAEAVACVLADFVTLKTSTWKRWKKALQWGVHPVPFQSFYVNLYGIQPERMLHEIEKNLVPFFRWGFYSDEAPLSRKKMESVVLTRMGPRERRIILNRLLQEKSEISVNDYLRALNGLVHRRQAERDLKAAPFLRAVGFTQARVYKKKT